LELLVARIEMPQRPIARGHLIAGEKAFQNLRTSCLVDGGDGSEISCFRGSRGPFATELKGRDINDA
jgi:hypothetical protein